MPWLINLIPDADAHCVLEPDELGLRTLPALAKLVSTPISELPGFRSQRSQQGLITSLAELVSASARG